MAYEFELALKDLAVQMLKQAHAAFLSGDRKAYGARLRDAAAAIEGISRLGISADNPRFLWVDRLICDWHLVDAMRALHRPDKLLSLYAACRYPPCPASLALDREAPYLPADCADVYGFYDPPDCRADALGETLEQAVGLYGALTGGGGAGVDLLYKAGLALRRGNTARAGVLAEQAGAVAAPWLRNCIDTLLRQIEEEERK